ncbi:MAG: DUF2800 domain-containing protein [Chthoniobacteraceae bacterium]
MFYQPKPDDLAVVEWAVTTLKVLAGDSPVITREEDCRVIIPGFENPGTADALVLGKFAHADLKTGAMRNYREQMAAYALGLMDVYFASEWTAYLLFCDQRELVTLHFTYAEANAVVERVVAAYHATTKQPALCEYCGWCSKEATCPARLALAQDAVAVTAPGFSFDAVLADNEQLSKFLLACSVLEDYRKRAEETTKERIQAGVTIPGWKLVTRRGPEFVDHVTVGHHIQAIGFGAILAAYGNLSAKKFRELWAQKIDKPFPEEAVKHGQASLSLRQTHKN